MGRRDAVQTALEVHARMREILPALLITYGPDWMTAGNGTSADFEGGLVHHTAASSSLARPFPSATVLHDGRPDLNGPLCNEAVPACTVDAPRLHAVAANPANHAGASGGRSMGPLPTTRLFNPKVRGLEIDYAGTVPMLAGQLLVAHVWSRAVADVVGGGDIERIRAHYETSVTGKWDIGAGSTSVDMTAFRAAAAAIASKATATPTSSQEDHVNPIVIEPGQARTIPNTSKKSADLWVALDNPNGQRVTLPVTDAAGKTTPQSILIEGCTLRIAVERSRREYHAVDEPGFPVLNPADPFVTNVLLGSWGAEIGPCLGVSVENRGHVPVTVVVAPHTA